MTKQTNELTNYFNTIALTILGIFLIAFPLVFSTITTDSFVLPKQIFLIFSISLFFIFFTLKTVADGKLTLKKSVFGLPIALFIIVLFASAVLSINKYDALIAFVPFLFSALLYYAFINSVKTSKQLLFILTCLVSGAFLASSITILSYFKIYILPFEYTHIQAFSTFGSLLDQAIYLTLVLPISGYFAYQAFYATKKRSRNAASPFEKVEKETHAEKKLLIPFTLCSLIIIIALGLTVSLLVTTNKPFILPFESGLQISFAAISQDSTNIFKGFLLGSGVGTYLTDFTRFKAASYNQYANLWAFTFFRSSTFVLELLATTGLLGILAFGFIIYRVVKEKTFFLPLTLAIIATFILPFSFTPVVLLSTLLAIFAISQQFNNPSRFGKFSFLFISKRKAQLEETDEKIIPVKYFGTFAAIIMFALIAAIVATPVYFATKFVISDVLFQQSLIAAAKNQGLETYNKQIAAIQMFPYRDVYYRGFSQTNIALANSLVASQKEKQPTEEVQQNILTLIQQSINAARTATAVAPLTPFNWNNLSSIYRSLIGFGENADQFTIITSQQAILLDSKNPQQYIELGGVYYQLGAYDEAIRQFQQAISLKQDYANGYYNLGHAFEAKGDLPTALAIYQTVQKLVEKDQVNNSKITEEINALTQKIATQEKQQSSPSAKVKATDEEQKPLEVNKSKTQLPERDPKVTIPSPKVSPTPTTSKTKTTITPTEE